MYTVSGAAAKPAAASMRKKRDWRKTVRHMQWRVRPLAEALSWAACMFVSCFIKWFQIPSPFGAAVLLASAQKPSPAVLAGSAASLLFRLIWGLEADWGQYAGCLMLWLILQKCRPRAGIETAALAGLAMMPRIVLALMGENQADILYSCAALPVAMFGAMSLRHGTDVYAISGASARGCDRFCMFLLPLLMVGGLGYFRLGIINLGQAAAVWAVLCCAASAGTMIGVLGGLLCGICLVFGGHDTLTLLALALCGFLCGLPPVARFKGLILPAAFFANGLALLASSGKGLALEWWSIGMGCAVWILTSAGFKEKLKPFLTGTEPASRSMENAFVTQRIAHMRIAIEKLARALPAYDEEQISAEEEVIERLCMRCSKREICWGRRRGRTERMMTSLVECSKKGQAIDEASFPALAELGCLRAKEAEGAAYDALRVCQRRTAAARKAKYERELTLTHLAALSGTLGELGMLASGESFNDLRAAHVITLALEERGVPARLLYARRVDGHLQAALETEGMVPVQKPLDGLLRYLAAEEEMPLSVSRAEGGRIELEEVPLYSASVGMASLCADGSAEGICGDACSVKHCEGGRMLMMLCDGMGHGEAAHRQSEKTLELLMLLLEAGYSRRQAITAVNGMMLGSQEKERFSTVDLADVDLWTGEVFSEKLGACASWIVRGSHMKKIEGSSLPLGILEEVSPTGVQYRLHSGDILLMMSDGIADAFAGDDALKQAIEESLYVHPQRMADAVLRNALLAGGGAPRDDMSVMVLLLMDRRHAETA